MNMTPNDPRTKASTCKSSGTRQEKSKAWIARIQALTAKETTSKAHMQVHKNKESRGKQPRRKPGPNRAETGLGWSAEARFDPVRPRFCPRFANWPSPFQARFDAPLTEPPFGLFIAPSPRATKIWIHHLPPQDREQEAYCIAKGALVAFIYFGGFYTMTNTTMSNIMG
jgi:hypothetical protein